MATLFTKHGRPLERRGDDIYTRSGRHVGRIRHGQVYAPTGHYAATLVGDRAVFRSCEVGRISSPFMPSPRLGSSAAVGPASPLWGDEPDFPD